MPKLLRRSNMSLDIRHNIKATGPGPAHPRHVTEND